MRGFQEQNQSKTVYKIDKLIRLMLNGEFYKWISFIKKEDKYSSKEPENTPEQPPSTLLFMEVNIWTDDHNGVVGLALVYAR